jgi:WD40 repeat protein
MRKLLYTLLCYSVVAVATLQAQQPCNTFECAYKKAEHILRTSTDKDKYQQVLANLDDAENYAGNDAEKKQKVRAFRQQAFRAIQAEKERADQKTREAIVEKERADSTATAAQRAARRAYANDLAYKSQIALRDGDRTTAYRLAEFAHRYVDDDNLQVTNAFVQALYYNDHPNRPPLPWASTLQGHTSRVLSVAFSPDGSRLATGSVDGTAKIWDVESGSPLHTLYGHTSSVSSVAFSPDGKRLATGSDDWTAKIWDVERDSLLHTLYGHKSSVSSVAFSPDGECLATGSDDWTVKIWDLEIGSPLYTLHGHTSRVFSVAFSPDGERLATGSRDGTAKIWDVERDSLLHTLYGDTSSVLSVTFSPDGERLATGSWDKTAKIWDVESGSLLHTIYGHTSSVNSVAFSPDGKRLATGSDDNTAKIWDLASGSLLHTFYGHTSGVNNSLTAGMLLRYSPLHSLYGPKSSVNSVAFSPDGERLATGLGNIFGDSGTAEIWDLESSSPLYTIYEHRSNVWSVAFSPDGKRLATGLNAMFGDDKAAQIWDLESGKAVFTYEGPTGFCRSVAFSPDGKRLATGLDAIFEDDKAAQIWDLESGKAVFKYEGPTGFCCSVSFSPDGKRLATGSGGKTVKIWDLESGSLLHTLYGHTSSVWSVAFSPDGKRLATGSGDKTAKIWDVESGSLLHTLYGHTFSVNSVAFSPDGERLATGSGDKTVKIWDLASGRAALTLVGHTSSVNSVAFSPDGKRLATGSKDETAKIWDLASGRAALTLVGHTSNVNSVAFSPDGKRLATGSDDKTAKIWDLAPRSVWWGGRSKGLAGLTLPQLSAYDLYHLLDQQPGNEKALIATGEVWQIKAFADLAAAQAGGSNMLEKVAPQYARAERLYVAALALQDERLIRRDYAAMLRRWSEIYRVEGRTAEEWAKLEKAQRLWHYKAGLDRLFELAEAEGKVFPFHQLLEVEYVDLLRGYGDYFLRRKEWSQAEQLYEKAQSKAHSAEVLIKLIMLSEETGGGFDFSHCLVSEDVWELSFYGDYFFEVGEWSKAKQLYEKAQGKSHSARVLIKLFEISEKTGETFDFDRFLVSEDTGKLRDYGDYFFEKEKWREAKQFYEKAQGRAHSARGLLRLFEISEKTGEAFDFGRFLAAADAQQLGDYARGFIQSISLDTTQYKDRVPAYQNALRIREQQMRLDTSAALRAQVVQEYNDLSYYQLFLPDGAAAAASIRRGLELDVEQANKYLRKNLAPALLLQGKLAEAEAEYREWAPRAYGMNDLATYRDAFLDDLRQFERAGVEGVDFELVRGWLKE